MSLIRIDRNPSRRQLNLFGAVWLMFFCVVGGLLFRGTGSWAAAAAVWALAAIVPAVGWVVPGFMRVVYVGMAYAVFPIGLVLSHLILAVVYYLVFTPTGLLMRLFGYDPMNRGFDADTETYWVARDAETEVRRYFRQF
jgi:hypothetical protein